jgi:hypothetical protein
MAKPKPKPKPFGGKQAVPFGKKKPTGKKVKAGGY